jgi:hypothetical protein
MTGARKQGTSGLYNVSKLASGMNEEGSVHGTRVCLLWPIRFERIPCLSVLFTIKTFRN